MQKMCILMLTYKCNLNCIYCYQKHKTSQEMTLETAKAIVTMGEVIEYLYNSPWGLEREIIINDDLKKALDKYYSMYGAE